MVTFTILTMTAVAELMILLFSLVPQYVDAAVVAELGVMTVKTKQYAIL
jgi:hypothetical protein